MSYIVETRRAGGLRRVSENVLWRNSSVDTAPAPQLQASFISTRFVVSDAVARAIAEHAFAQGKTR